MNKKILFIFGLLISLIFTFSITFSFATDGTNMINDAANGVRDVVGGAENAVEGAVKDVTNGSKNVTGNMENTMNNIDGNRNNNNSEIGATNNTGYTASRTATETTTTDGTFLGMSGTMWTWLILAVATVAIIGLVWYYSRQISSTNRYDE